MNFINYTKYFFLLLFKKVFNFLWLIRITLIIPIFFAGICSSRLCKGRYSDFYLLLIIISVCCLASGGFVLNDILDRDKDLIDKPRRPIPSGRIKKYEAYLISIFLILLALFFSILSQHYLVIAEVLIGIFLVLIYSSISKNIGWLGNLITAVLAVLPWLMPASYLNNFNAIIAPIISTFLLVFSREILLDIQDIQGDRLSGFKTLPILLGSRPSAWISTSLLFFVSIGLLILAHIEHYSFVAKCFAQFGIFVPALIISFIILTQKGKHWIKIAGHLGKFQFVCGILVWWLK